MRPCSRSLLAVTLTCILLLIQASGALAFTMKRVLVTGGNKGIGRAICQTLLEQYPDVHVILGARDVGRGKRTVGELSAAVPGCESRLDLVQIDTSCDESVKKAAEQVASMGGELYGVVNNAGIAWGNTFHDTLNTNYFGPRRVNEVIGKQFVRAGGRIINIASAAGPNFVSRCDDSELKEKLANPEKISGGIKELDEIAKSLSGMGDGGDVAYGLSKALLNAYTVLQAKENPGIIVNSCTPGYIATDMTKGRGAKNPPSKGAECPVHLLMSPEFEKIPSGRYYGSDRVRSPLHVYRGPGDPPYTGP